MEESRLLEDLTLLLLYAQSWREKIGESLYVTRSWKGYDFDVIERLAEKGYIVGSRRVQSVTLTDNGVKRGQKLKQSLLQWSRSPWSGQAADDLGQ